MKRSSIVVSRFANLPISALVIATSIILGAVSTRAEAAQIEVRKIYRTSGTANYAHVALLTYDLAKTKVIPLNEAVDSSEMQSGNVLVPGAESFELEVTDVKADEVTLKQTAGRNLFYYRFLSSQKAGPVAPFPVPYVLKANDPIQVVHDAHRAAGPAYDVTFEIKYVP